MLANPTPGQLVRIRDGKHYSSMMPYHDHLGTVVIVSRPRARHWKVPYLIESASFRKAPRNHGISINGKIVFIPCGNLFKVK